MIVVLMLLILPGSVISQWQYVGEIDNAYMVDNGVGYAMGFTYISDPDYPIPCCTVGYLSKTDNDWNSFEYIWTVEGIPPGVPRNYDVDFYTPQKGYRMQLDFFGNTLIYYTQDGSSTWSSEASFYSSPDYFRTNIKMINDSTLVVIGNLTSGSDELSAKTIDLSNHSITTFGEDYYCFDCEIASPSPNSVFIITQVDADTHILKSTDVGISWEDHATIQSATAASVFFIDNDIGFIGTCSGDLFRSNDGGLNWTPLQNLGTCIHSISFYDDQKGVLGGDDGKVFTSQDGGETWLLEILDTTLPISRIRIMPDQTVYLNTDDNHLWDDLYKNEYALNVQEGRKSSSLVVGPNPVNSILRLESNNGIQLTKVSIYNSSGVLIKEMPYRSNLDCSDLSAGMYLLRAVESNGIPHWTRIVKE